MGLVESTNVGITKEQIEILVSFAAKAGVNRKQWEDYFKHAEKRKALFSEMKNPIDKKWFKKLQDNAARIDGRIYLIQYLEVDYSQSFNSAIEACGSKFECTNSIFGVENLYLKKEEKVIKTIILFNWPKGNHGEYDAAYKKVIEFGLKNKLKQTTPHVIFSLCNKFKRIAHDLGKAWVRIIETTTCEDENVKFVCCAHMKTFPKHKFDIQTRYTVGGACDWFVFEI